MSRFNNPTIGAVVIHNGPFDNLIEWWAPYYEHETGVDVVFVEVGTDEETSAHNKDLCLKADVKRHWVSQGTNDTIARARNYGAKFARGEYLWFVDGDCEPPRGLDASLYDVLSPEVIVCGAIEFEQEDGSFLFDHRFPHMETPFFVTKYYWHCTGGNMVVPARLFERLNGFQTVGWAENDYAFESCEFAARALIETFTPLLLSRDFVVRHKYHEPSADRLNSNDNVVPFTNHLWDLITAARLDIHPIADTMMEWCDAEALDRR